MIRISDGSSSRFVSPSKPLRMKAQYTVRVADDAEQRLATYDQLMLAEAHARDAVDGGVSVEIVKETVVAVFHAPPERIPL